MNKNEIITQNAIKYVKENYKDIIKIVIGDKALIPKIKVLTISIFMAGSPGAGKTEWSKNLIKRIEKDASISSIEKIIRIDPDDIRKLLPKYNGKNSYLFQAACSIAIEKVHDYVLKNNLDFILDGTLSNYEIAQKNIQRSLDKNRLVFINYVYQNPLIAWDFTKKRELIEGRFIPKEFFIEQLFKAKENINKLKQKFDYEIDITLIKQNIKTGQSQIRNRINNIDNHIIIKYNKKELEKLLL